MESYLNNLFANKNILIINPCLKINSINIEGHPEFSMTGVFYSINTLKKNGYNVQYVDSFILDKIKKNGDIVQFGIDNTFLLEKINKLKSDYLIINFSSYQRIYKLINDDMEILINGIDKKNHTEIILADFLVSNLFYFPYKKEKILSKYKKIDYIFSYNFKKGLVNLMNDSIKKIKLDAEIKDKVMIDIKNINKKIKNDIDFSDIKIESYIDFFKDCAKYKLIKNYDGNNNIFPVFTSKGYNYKSSNHPAACSNKWKKFKISKIEKILIKLKENKINEIYILDKEANIKSNFFTKLIDLFIKYNLKANFVNGLRIDFLEESQIYKLNQITSKIKMIIDSTDQDFINNNILNNLNIQKVEEHIKLLINNNLDINLVYFIGHPNEKICQMNETIDFIWKYYKKFNLLPQLKYYIPFNKRIYNYFNFNCKINFDNYNIYPVRCIYKRINHKKLFTLYNSVINQIFNNQNNKIIINFNEDRQSIKDKKLNSSEIIECMNKNLSGIINSDLTQIDMTGNIDFSSDLINKLLILFKKLNLLDINLFINKINLFNKRIISRLSKIKANIFLDDDPELVSLHSEIKSPYIENIIKFIKDKNLKKILNKRCINFRLTKNNYKYLNDIIDIMVKNKIERLNIVYFIPNKFLRIESKSELKNISKTLKNLINNYNSKIKIKLLNFPMCYFKEYKHYIFNEYLNVSKVINIAFNKIETKNYYDKKNNEKCKSCLDYFICPGY